MRSYTPLPFLALMVVFARPTGASMGIGIALVIMGEMIRLWGVSIAGSETRTTGPVGGTFLITQGPFAYVRNPLYLGNMLLYVGVGVMSQALFPWLTLAALLYFLWQYALIVSLEEEYLGKKFGDEYSRYSQRVPRFFPVFQRYPASANEQPELDWGRGIVSERSTLLSIGSVTLLLVLIACLQSGR